MTMLAIIRSVLFLFIILIGPPLTGQYTNSNEATILLGQGPNPAPDRRSGEGEGPFERLIIRGGTLIDGTGGPPRGPVDIVIENNQIIRIASVGTPFIQIDEDRRPKDATYELDAEGMYILPGFVDLHIHSGNQFKAPDAEYTYKLWLAHGITTVRGVALGPMEWTLSERDRSAKNEHENIFLPISKNLRKNIEK